jgi:hypothetical protein
LVLWTNRRWSLECWTETRVSGSGRATGRRRAVQGKVARRSRGGRRPRRRTDAKAALARYQADAEGGGPEHRAAQARYQAEAQGRRAPARWRRTRRSKTRRCFTRIMPRNTVWVGRVYSGTRDRDGYSRFFDTDSAIFIFETDTINT